MVLLANKTKYKDNFGVENCIKLGFFSQKDCINLSKYHCMVNCESICRIQYGQIVGKFLKANFQ